MGAATLKEIWARADRASETRSVAMASYNVRRTMRRENGTPGDGCAVRSKRRIDVEIGRKPRPRWVAITSGFPAG